MLKYAILFIIFGIAGWIIDTSFRSLDKRKYSPRTHLPYFSVIYGLGGVMLILLFKFTNLPVIADIIVGGAMSTILELIGGMFCKKVLRKKLWDYSGKPYNYYGHVDAEHTTYWLILTAFLRAIFPYIPI